MLLQLDNLSTHQQQDTAESAALEASSRLLEAASAGHSTWRAFDESAAVKVSRATELLVEIVS